MTDYIWQNAGLLEVILATECVVLIAAAFFYQVAKIIAKTDRHDPLVRFYRVFWQAFKMPVSTIRELDLRQAEYAAREAGMVGLGDVSVETLSNIDAPDLVDLDEAGAVLGPAPDAFDNEPPATTKVQPIGRTGGENDTRLRTKGEAVPSRERQFIERSKAAREEAAAPMPMADDAPIPISRERDVTAAGPPPKSVPVTQTSATGNFDALINPFQPRSRITGRRYGEVLIDVTCAPEDGQANGIIIAIMSEQLGVRPYQIVLLRGHYKVRKTLQVAGLDQDILDAKLSRIPGV
ncbi:MAG TPA: DUF167 family protein [Tepidisphaeraceae bacterium]|jgi:uncharacterized protein YggU (UPF0235/DUF167 family)